MANRLANATSPYLLQHADNPVDWWEWRPEAFEEARRRDVPVFLSVGYSACHWCHVMAHESFEDEATAAQLNKDFVAIKVDREERPDIDAVYMGATQAMIGQGGWPMSVMLTPAGKPFYAGTYFPPEARHGMPSFRQLLTAISQTWQGRRDEVERTSADITGHLQAMTRSVQPSEAFDVEAVGAQAVRSLRSSYDERFGGFGGAPKFPPSMICEFLLRRSARTDDSDALQMAAQTMEAMARGGIYDQIGGGFARYSVDGRWEVPHFEKMLYDNAQLLSVYLHWLRLSGSPLAERVARETADFLLRELATGDGGFASALDADSEGREGAFYVWTPAQLREVLGDEEGTAAATVFSVTWEGNFEDGSSTLRLAADPADWGSYRRTTDRLLSARERRPRPARDDKVVAAWNGLAITALAEAGVLLSEPRFLGAALDAARLLVGVHLRDDGTLRRVSRDGKVGEPVGLLEDYACVAECFLTLYSATGDAEWFNHAASLVGQIRERFGDGEGAFFDTAADAETLVVRPRDPTDNATPSGHATTAGVFLTMFGLTGDNAYREDATALLAKTSRLMRQGPRFAGKSLTVAEALADGPRQLAVVGPDGDPGRQALIHAGFRLPYPGLVIAQGNGLQAGVPLLEGRQPADRKSAAYLCHGFVCDLPVTDPADLVAAPQPRT